MTKTVWLPYPYEAEVRYRRVSDAYRIHMVDTAAFQIDEAPEANLAFELETESGPCRWYEVEGSLMRTVLDQNERPISFEAFTAPFDPAALVGRHFYLAGWQDHPMSVMYRLREDGGMRRGVFTEEEVLAAKPAELRGTIEFWKYNWQKKEEGLARAQRIAGHLMTFEGALLRPALEPLLALTIHPTTNTLRLATAIPPILLRHTAATIYFPIDEHAVARETADRLAADRSIFDDGQAVEDLTVPVNSTGNWDVTGHGLELLAIESFAEDFVLSQSKHNLDDIGLAGIMAYGAVRQAIFDAAEGRDEAPGEALHAIEKAALHARNAKSSVCVMAKALAEARLARSELSQLSTLDAAALGGGSW